jgi:hypothetical protein
MKKRLLFFSLFGCGLAFGQNLSQGPTSNFVLPNPGPEVFRFAPGFVGQLIPPTTTFTTNPTDRWFSLGQFAAPSQTLYGQRFQYDDRALVMGYTSLNPNNPRIEWIHNGGSTAGNLQFRVASSFTSTSSNIVAEMTPQGNTYFGKYALGLFSSLNPKVGIGFNENDCGLDVYNPIQVPPNFDPKAVNVRLDYAGNFGYGVYSNVFGGFNSIGVYGNADAFEMSIGVYGRASLTSFFSAAVFGECSAIGSGNLWSGFFDGDVYIAGGYGPSDAKLKNSINQETSALTKISLLKPVTYNYNKVEGLNLPQTLQHGFISQEIAEVFPELTKDVVKPVFDENGKITSEVSFKALNYVGLISVLTAAIQELNNELIQVRQDLDEYKANDAVRGQIIQNTPAVNGYSIEQNVPNPFSDRTLIKFQLAPGVESATLSIFNLNGAFVRDYQLIGNSGEVEILASEIGKGMYIYSLNQNGQEIISKRMIVK